ncbi:MULTISPECIES: DUF2634 domain-containing protein [unclassified Anaerotruncus]|uniref:contractile injection system sheath initiator n=1 Tax=Anaerotruncus sp. 1XD42-93 TaxID=2320853 RepID=UPI000EA396DF|nr:DUF2634 domain-containing protein [Anaerotruncus sp. 1XD42-93]NCE76144.1 DUF2634 domain-containing protein [Anaerotruncus sp. X29]RKJ77664.1 DUF2634 domain-containing protein [Anaerotruncus sp. 1XD22-93]
MEENMTLLVDPETRDLAFDDGGNFKKIFDADTTVQNVRHALLTWKAEFFADLIHGTEYERIVGMNQNEIDLNEVQDIIREAIFQEDDISRIDTITVSYDGRTVAAAFTATLVSGETIALEVTA